VKEAEQGWAVIVVEVWKVADLYWDQVMGLGKSKPGVMNGEVEPHPSQWERPFLGLKGLSHFSLDNRGGMAL
jgi:hypothetical protein